MVSLESWKPELLRQEKHLDRAPKNSYKSLMLIGREGIEGTIGYLKNIQCFCGEGSV